MGEEGRRPPDRKPRCSLGCEVGAETHIVFVSNAEVSICGAVVLFSWETSGMCSLHTRCYQFVCTCASGMSCWLLEVHFLVSA